MEQYHSPAEVARMLCLHKETIRRIFLNFPGVLQVCNGRLKKNVTLRIPARSVQAYINQNTVVGPTRKA